MQLQSGALLQGGKYRITRTLGQGGFGITYEAIQVNLDRKVAVKEFYMKDCCERVAESTRISVPTQSNRELVEKFKGKFLREAKMIASLEHPNIVRVIDVFEENNTAYYVMENLPGGALSAIVKSQGPLTEIEAEEYILQVSKALEYIHAQNTVHLDVKPSNILLNSKGEAVLIDFGISKHYDLAGEQTSSTPVGVSKGFAPLEQGRDGDISQFTPATDIYALGATLYYLVTGAIPPEATMVYEDGLSKPDGISSRLWRVIEKSMQPRRKDRPQDIKAFMALLEDGDVNNDKCNEDSEKTQIVKKKDPLPQQKANNQGKKRSKPQSIGIVSAIILVLALFALCVFRDAKKRTNDNLAHLLPSASLVDSASYALGVNLYSTMKSSEHWRNVFVNSKFLQNVELYFNSSDLVVPDLNPYDFSDERKIFSAKEYSDGAASLGAQYGSSIRESLGGMPISFASMGQAINHSVSACNTGDESVFKISPNQTNGVLDRAENKVKEFKKAKNLSEQNQYLEGLRKKTNIKRTASGLAYEILSQGSSRKATSDQDTVKVNYIGKLLDGNEFDRNEVIDFPLKSVKKGWTEGLKLVGEGGKIRLYIPSDLGYGEAGMGRIGPNSLLIFDVDLLEVRRKQ